LPVKINARPNPGAVVAWLPPWRCWCSSALESCWQPCLWTTAEPPIQRPAQGSRPRPRRRARQRRQRRRQRRAHLRRGPRHRHRSRLHHPNRRHQL